MEVIFLMRRNQGQIATALVRGAQSHPAIKGNVRFRQLANGVLVTAQIYRLPHSEALCSGVWVSYS